MFKVKRRISPRTRGNTHKHTQAGQFSCMTSNASQTDKEEDDEAVLLHLIKSDTGLVYS